MTPGHEAKSILHPKKKKKSIIKKITQTAMNEMCHDNTIQVNGSKGGDTFTVTVSSAEVCSLPTSHSFTHSLRLVFQWLCFIGGKLRVIAREALSHVIK